jgi:hypothetical protein
MKLIKLISSILFESFNKQSLIETYKLTFYDKENIEKEIRKEYDKYLSDINKSNKDIILYKNYLKYAKDALSEEEYNILYKEFGVYLNMDLKKPVMFNKFYESEYDRILKDYINYKKRNSTTSFVYKSPNEKKLTKIDFDNYYNKLKSNEKKSIENFLDVVGERVNSGSGESIGKRKVRDLFFKTPESFQKMFSEKPSKYLWRGDYAHPCSDEYDHSDKDYLAMQSFTENKNTAEEFGMHFNATNIKSYSGSFSLNLFTKYNYTFNIDFGDDEGEVMFFDVVYKC